LTQNINGQLPGGEKEKEVIIKSRAPRKARERYSRVEKKRKVGKTKSQSISQAKFLIKLRDCSEEFRNWAEEGNQIFHSHLYNPSLREEVF
jgi:hypothetical protein